MPPSVFTRMINSLGNERYMSSGTAFLHVPEKVCGKPVYKKRKLPAGRQGKGYNAFRRENRYVCRSWNRFGNRQRAGIR